MNHAKPSEVSLDAAPAERRGAPRDRVLLSGVIANENGENAIDCLIVNLSAIGANVRLSKMLKHDADIYLVDTHNEMAHLATVVRVDADGTSLSFIRSYSVPINLPRRLQFLRKLLIDAKLRQGHHLNL